MGRAPRVIRRIADKKARNITFNKRYAGAIKKIYELGVLCDKETFLYVRDRDTRRTRYFSSSEEDFIPQYDLIQHEDRKGPRDVQHFYKKSKKKPIRSSQPLSWIGSESYSTLCRQCLSCQKSLETALHIWSKTKVGNQF